jgi:hypothetical protein
VNPGAFSPVESISGSPEKSDTQKMNRSCFKNLIVGQSRSENKRDEELEAASMAE